MSGLRYRVLGPLEVRNGDAPVALGGRKQRTVLAALLLDAGRVVSTDRLARLVWGEVPEHASATVQVYVSQLRRLLRSGEDDPTPLRRRSPGYVLTVPADRFDLAQATALAEQARACRSAGDGAAAANLLRLASGLWRGPALADLRGAPQLEELVVPLDRQRTALLHERYELELELGRHLQILGELEAAAAAEPYDEQLARLLVLALYRSGRQGEALDVLRRTAALLADDLGIDVGPALRELEAAVLRQDPVLDLVQLTDLSLTRQRDDRGLRGATLQLPGGAVVELQARTWQIGRHPSCQVVLADPECSRRHAEIRPVRGGYDLVDLGSTNGTRIAGNEIREHRLQDGDRIEIGAAILRYRSGVTGSR